VLSSPLIENFISKCLLKIGREIAVMGIIKCEKLAMET
jgi:hypothetical protein